MSVLSRLSLSILVTLLLVVSTLAQQPERNPQKEQAILDELRAIAPGSVEKFKTATEAFDREDYPEAARLYEEVMKKAPNFDVVFRRLGASLVEMGRYEEGMSLLQTSIEMKRSPENLASYAEALAYPPGEKKSSDPDKQKALELAKVAYQSNADDSDASYGFLVAQISADLDNIEEFRRVVNALSKKYPEVMATHYYAGILAASDSDWIKAENEFKKAESLGLPHEVAEKALASGIHTKATVWRYAYYSLYLLAAWVVGLLVLFVLGKLLSSVTLRWIEQSDPNVLGRDIPIRRIYRQVINIAGFYYYLSQPVVALLVIAIAGSIVYGCFMLGRIPIKLLAVVVVTALVTVYQMIRSLLIRVKSEDPGRALREDEAPGLWSLARKVAAEMDTRPVDEIRATPGTSLAVYERGNSRERMTGHAKRILIVGVGLLNDFKQEDFRAVLAHEYGHLSHRDTAGGDVALRVNQDMIKFAQAMAAANQAVVWNLAFQFVRVYHFIFRRISHGATRLQEVLADRVAVRNYGAAAFEQGLRHVIRRQIEFDDVSYWAISDAAKANRALQNLYELKPPEQGRVEEKIIEALNRPTSEDDTHPSPSDRFKHAARIVSRAVPPAPGMVWDLFQNRDGLTTEMSSMIEAYLRAG